MRARDYPRRERAECEAQLLFAADVAGCLPHVPKWGAPGVSVAFSVT